MKNLKNLFVTAVLSVAAMSVQAADYTTYLTAARGFTEVTSTNDMYDDPNYYYILTSAENTNLIVGIGRYERKPDWAPYESKALRYRSVEDPVADLSNFFTIERDEDYIGFRNVVDNSHLFQTHDNAGYMYVLTYSELSMSEWTRLTPTYQNDYWLFESGKYPISTDNWACGYLGPWNKSVAAGEPIALNRRNIEGDLAGHYRLFRIAKDDLMALKRTPLYAATPSNPVDATWFIVNPSFETGDETGWTLSGKQPNKNDETGEESENTEFRARNDRNMTNMHGNYVMNAYQWWNTVAVSQTVEELPSGEYILSAVAAAWEDHDVTFTGNSTTITIPGQGDGTGIPVSMDVSVDITQKLTISAQSIVDWWSEGHSNDRWKQGFLKFDNVQLQCKQLYLDGLSLRLPNNDATILTPNQWYYYDVSLGAEYILIGPLDGLVYSTDGDKSLDNASINSPTRTMTLPKGRIYFKTTRSDATLYITPKCAVSEGTFTAVALNVDGLPKKVAFYTLNEDGPGEEGTKKISTYLASKGYDFIGCSEDFNYNGTLMESLKDNYSCGTIRKTLSVSGLSGGFPFDTDGLNLIWKNSKISATNESWTRWSQTTSTDGNQYVKKGYRHYDVLIDGGALIDVFILHMDAGDATGSREAQWRQLADAVNGTDATRPKLIIGDTNSRWTREEIATNFMNLLNPNLRASDVWVEKCRNNFYPTTAMGDLTDQSDKENFSNYEVVDKILYINPTATNTVQLVPQSFKLENDYTYDFVDHDGNTKALGDHRPVVVEFKWMKSGDAMNMPITLTDNADNSTAIRNASDLVADVTLSGRTLYKDDSWNTLCLPFNLTISGSELDGATLKELDVESTVEGHKTGIEGNTLYLNFKEASTIEAGKPYIIKWSNGTDLQNPTFSGVTINNTDRLNIVCENDIITFKGIYDREKLTANDRSNMYITADNVLSWAVDDDFYINAFRAYFHLSSQAVQAARQCVMSFGDKVVSFEVSGIGDIESVLRGNTRTPWYTIDGRPINGQPTKPGVYIKDGRKVVRN